MLRFYEEKGGGEALAQSTCVFHTNTGKERKGLHMEQSAQFFFSPENRVAPLGIVAMEGAQELADKIEAHLVRWANQAGMNIDTFRIGCSCPRFSSGDGKGILESSVRGYDLYFVVDVGNYSCTYKYFGQENHMSPYDHYQDLKRLIQAAMGKAHRITVVMPLLYGGRQHRRSYRESLDCAFALQELQSMGVDNVVTFDAHDPRVQNAVPLMSFDNLMPYYQVLKTMFRAFPDISTQREDFMIVSPDEGALNRNMYYASALGVELGMFYKRRDYTTVINGRNPIVAHEYLGESVEGKTVFVADDIVASGDSMLEVARELKQRGAARIIADATFPLFTAGLSKFDAAVEEGVLDFMVGTNLTYRKPELLQRHWYLDVDVSKYAAYFVLALNHDVSVSAIADPIRKIEALLAKHAAERAQ